MNTNAQQQSSKCGDDCQYSLNNGELSIQGTGKMRDFYFNGDAPWYSERNTITKIVIKGITTIGVGAFQNMPLLKTVDIGNVTEIREGAFYNTGIESLTIPSTVQIIRKNAFEQCAGFIRITDGDNPLELTAVHPESYESAKTLLKLKRNQQAREMLYDVISTYPQPRRVLSSSAFECIVSCIVQQQISSKVAENVFGKLTELLHKLMDDLFRVLLML